MCFLNNLKADLTQVTMAIATFLFTAVYASSDEIHQSFTPGRDFDFLDILLDTLGGLTGWLLFTYLCNGRKAKKGFRTREF